VRVRVHRQLVLALSGVVLLTASCSSVEDSPYPVQWPAAVATLDVSGIYQNGLADSSDPEANISLFSLFHANHSYYERANALSYSNEFDDAGRRVQIEQGDGDLIVTLLGEESRDTKLTFFRRYVEGKAHFFMTPNAVAITPVHWSRASDTLEFYEYAFQQTIDGSLVLRSNITLSSGHWWTSARRSSTWCRWDRVESPP